MDGRAAMTVTELAARGSVVPDSFSEEQREFGRQISSFLAKAQPLTRLHALVDDPDAGDPELWRRAAGELDVLGLMIPEEYGGSGFGFAEVSLVLQAAGEHLTCWPFLSSAVLATHCVLACDDGAKRRLLPELASGAKIAAVAMADSAGRWQLTAPGVSAARDDSGEWRLTGSKSFVADAHVADVVLVVAHEEGEGPRLFIVGADAAGVEVTVLPSLDRTRPLSRVTLDAAPAQPVGSSAVCAELSRTLPVIAAAALVYEQVGGTAGTMARTVQYAKDRRQFGRSIGSFQAVKHRCADMYARSEVAAAFGESLAFVVDAALRDGTVDGVETAVAVASAAVYCGDAYQRNAEDMMQIHGGIGFTWEHDAHLYLRRAVTTTKLFGGRSQHLATLTRIIAHGGLLSRANEPAS